jgi:hypothetical protein
VVSVDSAGRNRLDSPRAKPVETPLAMASATKKTWNRRERHHTNMGRRRKAKQSRRSTVSIDELFAACGEPGKPAPAATR